MNYEAAVALAELLLDSGQFKDVHVIVTNEMTGEYDVKSTKAVGVYTIEVAVGADGTVVPYVRLGSTTP